MRRIAALTILAGSVLGCVEQARPPLWQPARTLPGAPPRPAAVTWRTTPDAPFRLTEPGPEEMPYFVPPPIERTTLSNGIPVWTMKRGGTKGVLSLRIVSTAIPESAGFSRAYASLLPTAALLVTSSSIKAGLADAYAEERVGSGFDYIQIGAAMLGTRVDGVLEQLSNMTRKPTYPASSFEWFRARRQAILDGTNDSGQAVAFRVLRHITFGPDHPYATLEVTPAVIARLDRENVLRAHEALLAPDQVTIVATGDFRSEDLLPKLETAFGNWKVTPQPGTKNRSKAAAGQSLQYRAPAAAPASSARVIVVDKPGSPHAELVLGSVGPAFSSPDFSALDVATDLLGTLPNSLIRKRLHDELHLSYDGWISLPAYRDPGLVSWYGKVPRERVAEALQELTAASKSIATADAAPDELAKAKEASRKRFVSDLETADNMSGVLVTLVALKADPTEPGRYQDKIDAVTAADVKRVSQSWLDFARWKVVIVGDWSALRQQLSGLGWGAIELRDARGKLLSTVQP